MSGLKECEEALVEREREEVRGGDRERERVRWRSRDYSAVYSNGQSDPHQSQRAAPPSIPDTLV